jgi:hypothetical protein
MSIHSGRMMITRKPKELGGRNLLHCRLPGVGDAFIYNIYYHLAGFFVTGAPKIILPQAP